MNKNEQKGIFINGKQQIVELLQYMQGAEKETLIRQIKLRNPAMAKELIENSLWNGEMIDKVIKNKGSVQNIVEIPEDIRYRYKDVWEISQKTLLDLSIIRNKFIDQSQSLNVYHADAKYGKIASALMYAWRGGLKTGVYYTRTKSKLEANSKLAMSEVTTIKQKPKDSQFECFGCSA
jgi:ribonucleotide reductase alpha subunit